MLVNIVFKKIKIANGLYTNVMELNIDNKIKKFSHYLK